MASITPLIELIENPTEYVKATGRVRILSIPADDVETVDNIGIGTGVLVDNTDVHNPKIRTLINGSDITIQTIGNEVEINYTGVPPNSVMNNIGTGEPILTVASEGTKAVNFPREFRTLTAGSNITLTPTADEIEISSFANVTTAYASSFRLEIDPSSNPDPGTGGLLIPANPTVNAQFSIPWVSSSVAGLCSAYNQNEINPISGLPDFDFSNCDAAGGGVIKFNNDGKFRFSFNCYVLGQDDNPTDTKIIQILKNGDLIFPAPAASAFASQLGCTSSTVPFKIYPFCGSGNVQINAGDEIIVACILNNFSDDNIMTLCNNFSCERLDAPITGLIGPQGPPGAVNEVVNDPSVGNYELVENPGAPPGGTIVMKKLKAGANITITDNTTDLEISSSGGGSVTLANLVPAPPFGGANILDNPGTGSGPFNFKELVESAGINITSGPTDITISVSPMEPLQLGGAYGNMTDTENMIGYSNQAVTGTSQESNVIGSYLPIALTTLHTNIMASYPCMGTSSDSYSDSNIIVSGNNSQVKNSTNTNILASSLAAGSTSMNSCVYIGDMGTTVPSDKSMCINSNLYGNNITMNTESVYFGTGQNAINLSSGECHFDFRCPAWYYHDLQGAPSGTGHLLHYDSTTKQITYDLPPSINSTFANVGAGQSLLEAGSIGTFPVTTTRSFKTLVAGANITLTPSANDITISSTVTSNNIYNTDGTLTAARTLTLGGFNLTITGSGNYNLTNTGQVNLGTTNATVVNIGRNGIQTVFNSANIAMTNLPTGAPSQLTVVSYDTVNKVINYIPQILVKDVFSVGLASFSLTGPFASPFNVPSSTPGPLSYSIAQPTNHPGYDSSAGGLDVSTGVYLTGSVAAKYEITVMLSVKNDTEIPNFNIEVRNVIAGTVLSECKCTSGQINTYNTFVLSDRMSIANGTRINVRLVLNNGAASTYTFERFVWSVNII